MHHMESLHGAKVLTCQLCQNIFLNYGSFKSHVCYGTEGATAGRGSKFACKLCDRQDLQTFLEFQHHVRKSHHVCEICLTDCQTQESLYKHCIQHSQETMCMKCFLSYEGQGQFRKHLHFKHDQEHHLCTFCKRKTWQHVYHFCVDSLPNDCEVCDRDFDTLQKYR